MYSCLVLRFFMSSSQVERKKGFGLVDLKHKGVVECECKTGRCYVGLEKSTKREQKSMHV